MVNYTEWEGTLVIHVLSKDQNSNRINFLSLLLFEIFFGLISSKSLFFSVFFGSPFFYCHYFFLYFIADLVEWSLTSPTSCAQVGVRQKKIGPGEIAEECKYLCLLYAFIALQ